MAAAPAAIETDHEDMIHDVQMDYYSRRFATCSSDRTIKIYDADKHQLQATLRGHEGPVWGIQWAHPKFGTILASCSYDRKVIIWKETSPNNWQQLHTIADHESSVNAVAWGPHEYGLALATASTDGAIYVAAHSADDNWVLKQIPRAHEIGVNAVSWAPSGSISGSIEGDGPLAPRRLVSGGCDNTVKIWRFNEQKSAWESEAVLEAHTDWVRDVAWAPNIGLPVQTIASCSEDHSVIIWTQDDSGAGWSKKLLHQFDTVVWRVSWSVTGNILAVSAGDNKVTLWKESLDGEWKCISSLSEAGAQAADTA
eukprot:TRINITY_DN6535_c0_g1_i1.p1 TRINITY_DN6535_c0_g1~~TRINITY_DN6535_c0_g1_i1.p1  ORF type:complete len:311 (+),score=39.07 TRINITY_DN6535_c0_g1_i1:109-1041(+)